jgi:glycosyltransferase involved in cell wall biosynthesis
MGLFKAYRLLIFAPVPPPIHGEALATQFLINGLTEKIKVINTNKPKRTYVSAFNPLWLLFDLISLIQFCAFLPFSEKIYLSLKRSFWGAWKDVWVITLSHLFRRKIFAHIHGGDYGFFYQNSKPFFQKVLKKSLQKVTKFVVVTEHSKQQLLLIHTFANIEIVSNTIAAHSLIKNNFNQSQPLKIVYLSYVTSMKGADVFLSIAEQAFKQNKNWQFEVYGAMDPQFLSVFNRQSSLLNNLKYLGELQKNKFEVLQNHDVLIFPSKFNEAQGIVLLEAMSVGLTVLTHGIAGMKDTVIDGRNGFLSQTNSAGDYFNFLEKLDLERNLLRQIGQNNIKDFADKFNPKIFNERMQALLGVK